MVSQIFIKFFFLTSIQTSSYCLTIVFDIALCFKLLIGYMVAPYCVYHRSMLQCVSTGLCKGKPDGKVTAKQSVTG